jgi:hypothetical protein
MLNLPADGLSGAAGGAGRSRGGNGGEFKAYAVGESGAGGGSASFVTVIVPGHGTPDIIVSGGGGGACHGAAGELASSSAVTTGADAFLRWQRGSRQHRRPGWRH